MSDLSSGQQNLPFATQALNQAFSPNTGLDNQIQNQVRDQTNAQLASSGLTNTPFGAGIMGTNQTNADIALANNQQSQEGAAANISSALQGANATATNAATGLQNAGATQQNAAATLQNADSTLQNTASTLQNQYGAGTTQGATLEALGPQTQMSTAEGLQGLQSNALAQQQQAIQDWLSYMGQGTQASQVGVQEAGMQNQAASSNAAQSLQTAGMGLSMMSGLMGK
jgi:hypothetical protein